ncbi:MAG: hypothetical protein ABF260_11590 [Flavobacteriaceae bacterium]
MKYLILIFLFFVCDVSISQYLMYTGFIGDSPIDLILHSYSDGNTQGVYSFKKNDNPVEIKGEIDRGNLILSNSDTIEKRTEQFIIPAVSLIKKSVTGIWKDLKSRKEFKIQLTKTNQFDLYDETTFSSLEFMQAKSSEDHYFRLILTKKKTEDVKVIGVKVYQKVSDSLINYFSIESEFIGLNNVSIGDFNFDGEIDFSVFEASYFGRNTTSIYFLKSKGNNYFKSDFRGVSLQFDSKKELITEHNNSNGSIQNKIYSVKNNKMIFIREECFTYDFGNEEFIFVNCGKTQIKSDLMEFRKILSS